MTSQKRVTDLCRPKHPLALQVTQNSTTGGMFHLVYSNSSNELDNPHNTLISIVVYQCRLQVRLQYCPVLHTLQEIILYILSCGLLLNYRKIPKISPGAYISQRPFLRGLFLEGLIYGGKFAFQNRLD